LTSDNERVLLPKSSPSIDQSRELHEDQEIKENEKEMRNIFASKKVPQLPKVITPKFLSASRMNYLFT